MFTTSSPFFFLNALYFLTRRAKPVSMTRIKRKEFKQTFPYTRDELWLRTANYIQGLPAERRRYFCRLILRTYVDPFTMALHGRFHSGITLDRRQTRLIVFEVLKRDLRGAAYRFVRPDMMELLLVKFVRDCERESLRVILVEIARSLNVKFVAHVSGVYDALVSIMRCAGPAQDMQKILLEEVARFRSNFS